MQFPSIHLNGTSRSDLIDQHIDALDALRAARAAVAAAAPNGRDYYVQPRAAFGLAQGEHADRLNRISLVIDELAAICEHIDVVEEGV